MFEERLTGGRLQEVEQSFSFQTSNWLSALSPVAVAGGDGVFLSWEGGGGAGSEAGISKLLILYLVFAAMLGTI